MKLTKWIAGVSFLALGLFASCKKDNNGLKVDKGTTYMTLTINMDQMLRAEDTNYNSKGEWAGADKIERVDVFLISGGSAEIQSQTGTQISDKTGGKYELQPWKTTAGEKEVYVIVNGDPSIISTLQTKSAAEFPTAYAAVQNMIAATGGVDAKFAKVDGDKHVITMTGEKAKITVIDDVKEGEASTKNKALVNVRRMVALVSTTLNQDLATAMAGTGIEVKASSSSTATVVGYIKNVKWSVGQFEKTSKLFEAKTVTTGTDGVQSPNYDWVPSTTVPASGATTRYDYTYLKQEPWDPKGFTRATASEDVTNITKEIDDLKFITETTHQHGATASASGYRKGNTPYVLVTATFTPADNAWATPEEKSNWEKSTEKHLYWGNSTGKFYSDLTRAQNDNKIAANASQDKDGVIKFTDAKMYYLAWINPDSTDKTAWLNSPVVRNNLYHVNVKGFMKLGFSGNPFNPDPEDPTPNPDPDDPVPDPEDPLNDKETWMTTEITVINWGVHSYDIEF